MKELDMAKKVYQNIKIPAELNERITKELQKTEAPANITPINTAAAKRAFPSGLKICMTAAAACVILFVTGLNTSEAFAENAGKLPVIGSVAKVLTLRSYEESDKDKTIKVTLPEVVSKASVTERINKLIEEKSKAYTKEAAQRVKEYKDAFLETGGTEEEFSKKDIKIKVDYTINYQDDDMVSFVLYGAQSWVSAYDFNTYFNIDLKNNTEIALKDLLGPDYVDIANQSIKEQMKQRLAENSDNTYFTPEEGGFTSIDSHTKFYINDKKNPVIVFDKYEIAPGSMGSQEFEILKK